MLRVHASRENGTERSFCAYLCGETCSHENMSKPFRASQFHQHALNSLIAGSHCVRCAGSFLP